MSRMTNKQLRQMFTRLNKAYFSGLLTATVKFADLTDIEADGVCQADEIEIDNAMKYVGDAMVEIVLLHEMVHAELPGMDNHSLPFQARIVGLFNQGAYDGLL